MSSLVQCGGEQYIMGVSSTTMGVGVPSLVQCGRKSVGEVRGAGAVALTRLEHCVIQGGRHHQAGGVHNCVQYSTVSTIQALYTQ